VEYGSLGLGFFLALTFKSADFAAYRQAVLRLLDYWPMTYGLVPSLIQPVKMPMTECIRESGLLDTFFINFAQIRSGAEKGGDKGEQ